MAGQGKKSYVKLPASQANPSQQAAAKTAGNASTLLMKMKGKPKTTATKKMYG